MDHLEGISRPASGGTHFPLGQFTSRDVPKRTSCGGLSRGPYGVALGVTVFVLLMNAGVARTESPDPAFAEGIASSRITNPEAAKARIGTLTMLLLTADGVTRAFDAYSTVRMLQNRCNGDLSVPVCNEEMFLPGAVTQSKARIYGYESSVWITQVLAVRKLSRHHQRLARLIPTLDVATTLPFAVNNLRLPIHVPTAPMHVQWKITGSR